jgi:hypothetical protein
MRNLIKGALIRVAIAALVAVGVSSLTSLSAEPELSIVRAVRGDRAAAEAYPGCAPGPVKMPCLQPSASQSREAS